MEEIWTDIEGYEGYYQVSNFGRIRSLDREVVRKDGIKYLCKSKIKKLTPDKDGYLVVSLNKNGHNTKYPVHRIVAQAFVSNYKQGLEVNHIDTNRQNNHYSNLEWISHGDSIIYSIDKGNHVSVSADYNGINNPNFGNHTLHEKYANDPVLSKQCQSRPKGVNGRARKITMVDEDFHCTSFDCIADCAELLINMKRTSSTNVTYVATNITKAANSHSKYAGYMFSFV